jgi:hypothetical protein
MIMLPENLTVFHWVTVLNPHITSDSWILACARMTGKLFFVERRMEFSHQFGIQCSFFGGPFHAERPTPNGISPYLDGG